MLMSDVNEFHWSVDNYSDLYSSSMGTTVNAGGSTHTKGSEAELIAGAALTEDCYYMAIKFFGGGESNTIASYLADIVVDPAGGTSWSVLIPNLVVDSPHYLYGGAHFVFPLFVKAGSSVGFKHQCSIASRALRCAIKLYGKPSKPEFMRYGHTVEAIGVNTGTSLGVSITTGASNAKGDWASVGTTTQDNWFWQMGIGLPDTTCGASFAYYLDMSAGDASNKRVCMDNVLFIKDNTEQAGKIAISEMPPIKQVPSGETVYIRGAHSLTADSGLHAAAYGVR